MKDIFARCLTHKQEQLFKC